MTDELLKILTKPRNIKAEMRRVDARIEDTRLMMLPSAIRYDTDKVISSPSDPMLKFAEQIDELEQQKKKLKEEYLVARSKLLNLVDKLSDNIMKDVIQARYMSEMRFKDIVETIPVEEAQMYRLHNKAIGEMEEIIKHDSE